MKKKSETAAIKPEQAVRNRKIFFLSVLNGFAKVILGGALLFLLAGKIIYIQAWVFLGISLLITMAAFIMMRKSKELIKERLQPGKDAKKWDSFLVKCYTLAIVVSLLIAPLDTGRFHWSPALPVYAYIIAYIVLIAGGAFSFWAMRTNAFFSAIVRIQKDRDHTVIKTGPYRFVRHPGYTGLLICIPAIPLVFGSFWGLIPAIIADLLLIIRTGIEDKTLQKELTGYREYTQEVRFRLIPGLW